MRLECGCTIERCHLVGAEEVFGRLAIGRRQEPGIAGYFGNIPKVPFTPAYSYSMKWWLHSYARRILLEYEYEHEHEHEHD